MIYKPNTNTSFEENLSAKRAIHVQSTVQQTKVNPMEMPCSGPEYQSANPFQSHIEETLKIK